MDSGSQFPIVEIRSSEAERLAHLLSIARDLGQAQEQALLLRESQLSAPSEDDEAASRLHQALFTSAVITYCRAFATGRRSGLSEVDFATLSPEALQAHRWFVKVRDQHIAHQVLPLEEVRIGIAVDPQASPPAIGVAHLSIKHQATDVEGTETLVRLIDVLLARLNVLISEHQEAVLEEARAMTVEDLMRLPPVEITVQGVPLSQQPPR